jgi:hypothetical protein
MNRQCPVCGQDIPQGLDKHTLQARLKRLGSAGVTMDELTESPVARSDSSVLFRAFLWLFGAVVGFGIAFAAVSSSGCTVFENGARSSVHSEVRLFNIPIHEASCYVVLGGIGEPRAVKRPHAPTEFYILVYGIIAVGTLLGSAVSVSVGNWLARGTRPL